MGRSRWRSDEYATYSMSVKDAPRSAVYSRTSKAAAFKSGQNLNPEKIQFRESRDSEANPKSCPIIVGLDVTGSMGIIAEKIAKKGLGVLVGELLERQPVADPHMLFMGIGDVTKYDQAPLQCTQFEADNAIVDQLTDIWLEGGGGGNHFESYDLAWAFAAHKTRTDQWDKRKEKGYLFTIGDEEFPRAGEGSGSERRADFIRQAVSGDVQDMSPEGLLKAAQERYHVFHVIVAQGDYASRYLDRVEGTWGERLQRRSLTMADYNHVSEVIVSAIAVNEGRDPEEVVASWTDENAAAVVRDALFGRNDQ